jgi:hypothetical protein
MYWYQGYNALGGIIYVRRRAGEHRCRLLFTGWIGESAIFTDLSLQVSLVV